MGYQPSSGPLSLSLSLHTHTVKPNYKAVPMTSVSHSTYLWLRQFADKFKIFSVISLIRRHPDLHMEPVEGIGQRHSLGVKRSSSKISVLVVDDDTTCLTIVAAILKTWEYDGKWSRVKYMILLFGWRYGIYENFHVVSWVGWCIFQIFFST